MRKTINDVCLQGRGNILSLQRAQNEEIKRPDLILPLVHGVALSKSFNLSVLSNYVTLCVAEKVAWEEVAIIPYFSGCLVSIYIYPCLPEVLVF